MTLKHNDTGITANTDLTSVANALPWVYMLTMLKQRFGPLRRCLQCMQARSLLTAHEDFTTLQFHAGTEIQRPGFVFSALKQRLDEAKVEEIKRICLTVDQKCAIFDVPSEHVKVRLVLLQPCLRQHTMHASALLA